MLRVGLLAFLHSIAFSAQIYNEPVEFTNPTQSWLELRDENLTRQKYDYSCGAASLSSILTYYYNIDQADEFAILESILLGKGIDINKKEHSIEQLRKKVSISFYDLGEYAKTRGFTPIGLALDMENLAKLQIPVIVHINVREVEHFSVFKGMDSDFVYLADPSFGNIKISHKKFQEMFYQREDAKYPGRILAFVPKDRAKIEPNQAFMHLDNSLSMVYEIILDRHL